MLSIVSTLREATPERHKLAVQGPHDGSLTITLTRQTDAEIRTIVKNGDSIEYGVSLTEHGTFCSCKDALYRGTTCKHALALAIRLLQHSEPTSNQIHLMWDSGEILCGEKSPRRFWQRWTLNALNWTDLVCQGCVHTWLNPIQGKAVAL